LLLAWVVFPLVLTVLSLGCGLLVEQASGGELPRALLPPAGLALLVVEANVLTTWDATAEFTAPVAIALAIGGFGSAAGRLRRPGVWAVVCAAVTFVAYAAPIVLSGRPTFAGYITLDDTATWFALTDRVMDHGHTVAGLAPSTYQQVLADLLPGGYPTGALMPLGLGAKLTGQDVAWLFQPTLAFYASMLALAIHAASARLVSSPILRAAVGILGAQAALLFAYSLWSGIKEVAAASMIALVCASGAATFHRWHTFRSFVTTALGVAALLAILSTAGAVWLLVPALVGLAVFAARGLRVSARIVAALVGVIALLSLPSISSSGSFISGLSSSEATTRTEVANLGHPLDALQVFGIWPATDFRGQPNDKAATYVLIAAVVLGIAAALLIARKRRAPEIPLYVLTGFGGVLLVLGLEHVGLSSPWLNAKAMAEASPALVAGGVAGAAALVEIGRRTEGTLIGAGIAAGVLWSNGLAYSGAWLAPRAQLVELQTVGEHFAGQGPTLLTDPEVYGPRHFLRNMDPEGASDRRRRLIPLLSGQGLGKGSYADLDRFQLDAVLIYKTLVLARSPSESRPPSVYSLAWRGRYYDVWQRPDPVPQILAHLPLGDAVQPAGVPACGEVMQLAELAGPSGRLAAPVRAPDIVVDFAGVPLPAGWASDSGGHVYPRKSSGMLAKDFSLPQAGRYAVWLGGSFRGRLRLYLDGRLVAEARNRLRPAGYEPLGAATLRAGVHRLMLRYGGADLHPGSGGYQFGLGPFVLTRGSDGLPVRYVPSARARTLCGRYLDWIEALRS
jgi:hypothetical protein